MPGIAPPLREPDAPVREDRSEVQRERRVTFAPGSVVEPRPGGPPVGSPRPGAAPPPWAAFAPVFRLDGHPRVQRSAVPGGVRDSGAAAARPVSSGAEASGKSGCACGATEAETDPCPACVKVLAAASGAPPPPPADPAAPPPAGNARQAAVAARSPSRGAIPAGLTVSSPSDPAEREAEALAARVLSAPAAPVGPVRPHTGGAMTAVHRACADCDETGEQARGGGLPEREVQRAGEGAAPPVTPAITAAVETVTGGGGEPLPPGERQFFEERFGYELSRVRVHADRQAAEAARELQAEAFTLGGDVAFAEGRYRPGSESGRHLLAHELAHVIQQGAAAPLADGGAPAAEALVRADGGGARIARQLDDDAPLPSSSEGMPMSSTATSGEPEPAAARGGLIVEDDTQTLTSGQMRKSDFLGELRVAACAAADQELARAGRDTEGCPHVGRLLSHYARKSAAHLERAIRKFVPGASATMAARDYIPLVAARMARGVQTWVETGSLPSDIPDELLTEMAAETGVGGVIAGAIGNLFSSLAGAVGGALSAIGGLFFKEGPGGARTGADRGALSARLGPGRPLDSAARTRMETAFGQSFGTVRVHDDTGAAGLARDLGAQAFTLGTHVAFAGGTYRPGTPVGDALLAHELAHVVQQGGEAAAPQAPAPDPLGKRQVPDAAVEEEADQAAAGALASLYAPGVQPPPWRPRRRGGVRLSRCAEAQPPESKVPAPGAKAPAESKVPAPAGSMAPPEAEEPAPPAAEETQIDWMVVLPEASAEKPGRRVEKADNATGPLTRFELDRSGGSPEPTFRYRTDVGAISDGEQLLGDKDKIDAARAAVAQIERARDAIPQRFFVVRDTPTQMGTFAGFERSAAKNVTDKIAAEGSADERRADADYAAWLKKRKGAGMGGFATFEGDPSSMQAADKANLTIGPGLAASGGVFQRVLKAVMDKSPEARQAFFAAGISMTAKTEVGRGDFQLVVVDTDKKWKLVSTDAELYLRANSRLLSLFVNVAQGFLHGLGPDAPVSEEARMAVFEAELAEVKRTKGGLDEKWFTDAEAFTLAARGVHSGKFPASSFKPASPGTTLSTADVVAILQTKFRQEQIDSMLKNIRNVR